MSNNLLYLDVGILINKTINIKLPVHASFLIHCRDHIHHIRNLDPCQRNPEKKANWTGWFRYLMSKFDAKSIKMNFDRFVTSGILWITLGGDIGPAWVGLQSKCLRKWSPSLLSSHLMILIAESKMHREHHVRLWNKCMKETKAVWAWYQEIDCCEIFDR